MIKKTLNFSPYKRIIKKCLVSGLSIPLSFDGLTRFAQSVKSSLTILGYHRIKDVPCSDGRFDDGLINATCEEFEWQVKYLKRNFNPITFNDLKGAVESAGRLPERPVIITFDDGFDDNYFNAFGILKDHSVPATFFITTGLMDSNELFWFEKIHFILSDPKLERIPCLDGGYETLNSNRAPHILALTEELKKLPDQQRRQYIQELEASADCSPNNMDSTDSKTMTWDQVIEMSVSGMEIGSHSVTHPILSMLTDSNLAQELQESKTTIEQRIGKEVTVLAYPNGSDASVGKRVEDAAKDAGYSFGVKYGLSGNNHFSSFQRYSLKRVGIQDYHRQGSFKLAILYPQLVF